MELLRYSDFLNEKSQDAEILEKWGILESEYLRMKEENLSEEIIKENIFTSLLGSLGGGFTDVFKNYMVDWAVERFGIKPFDANGNPTFFYQLIRNVIEGVHFTDLGKYLGKGSCKHWAEAIVEGLAETLEERTISYILPLLGLNMDMSSGLGATVSASLREALTNAINDTKFINRIEQMISDKICGFSLEDVISQAKVNPADKAKMATEVEKAGEINPDIFAQMMKTGLSEVI
jgi:hypothetical protein